MPEIPTPPAALDLEVELAGSIATVTESDAAFWSRLRVFNTDHVKLNLRFDDPSGPNPASLLTVGEPNVETEEKLRKAKARLEEQQPRLQPAQNEASIAAK